MLNESLAVFFNTKEFAVEALYNEAMLINGIFGKAYIAVNDVESTAPSFTCALRDVQDVKHGDTLTIDNAMYRIVGVKPDGTGIVSLILEEASLWN